MILEKVLRIVFNIKISRIVLLVSKEQNDLSISYSGISDMEVLEISRSKRFSLSITIYFPSHYCQF
jgi:hypothetical protein